jgi:hypothetical protein
MSDCAIGGGGGCCGCAGSVAYGEEGVEDDLVNQDEKAVAKEEDVGEDDAATGAAVGKLEDAGAALGTNPPCPEGGGRPPLLASSWNAR